MVTEKFTVETEVVCSDDGKETYEIHKKCSTKGKKALVVELYPAISKDRVYHTDLSTMHLTNHMAELGWNEVRIVNLYPDVFGKKPYTEKLKESPSNMGYISDIISSGLKGYDIVIAWGSSLEGHKCTEKLKASVLNMVKENGLGKQLKHLLSENLSTESQTGTHPLYMGLRHSSERWFLGDYPLNEMLEKFEGTEKKEKENTGRAGKSLKKGGK